jgi:thermitase
MTKYLIIVFLVFITKIFTSSGQETRFAPNQAIAHISPVLYEKLDEFFNGNSNLIHFFDSVFNHIGLNRIQRLHYFNADNYPSINDLPKKANYTIVIYFKNNKNTEDVIKLLENNNSIEYVYPNYLLKPSLEAVVPNDPKFWHGDQAYLFNIMMPYAWGIEKGCSDIRIAILDVGFRDLKHEDLTDKFLDGRDVVDMDINAYVSELGYEKVKGEDYSNPDNDPSIADCKGCKEFHGLQMSGIAAAETNNLKGIAGIGWNTKIVPVRVGAEVWTPTSGFDPDVEIEIDDLIRGIDWIRTGKRAEIINKSLSITESELDQNTINDLELSINTAVNDGIIFIAASGNDGEGTLAIPSVFQNVISIGATDINDNRWGNSNFGDELDIVAPGVDIITTHRRAVNKYKKVTGTSASSAIVSGSVSLILSQNPYLDHEDLREVIIRTADKVSGMGGNNFTREYGFGRINVYRALNAVPQLDYRKYIRDETITDAKYCYASGYVISERSTVFSEARAKFKATNYVELKEGFEVLPSTDGVNFEIEIAFVGTKCSGSMSRQKSVFSNEQYSKTVTPQCIDIDSTTHTHSSILNKKGCAINAFPNPFGDFLNIECNNGELRILSIELIDISGKIITIPNLNYS